MLIWIVAYPEVTTSGGYLSGSVLHGHEMVFGFTTAVIAGFLLTAVPNWTGAPALQGGPLAFLVALWFAGRVAVLAPGGLPTPLVIAADVAFLPALALVLAPALLRKRNGRNLGIPPLLVLAAGANALVHLGALGVVAGGVQIGLQTGVDIVVVLLVVIGGRVVPLFTGNALRAPMRAPDCGPLGPVYRFGGGDL
jgi:uncharacterized protein involved in response to NO